MNRDGLGATQSECVVTGAAQRVSGNSQPEINSFGSVFAPGDKVIQTLKNHDK